MTNKIINELDSLEIHDSVILNTEIDVLNQSVSMKLQSHNGIYTIRFKGVVCFNFTGLNLWSNSERNTILDLYQINDNYIVQNIKDVLGSQLRDDINATRTGQGFAGKRYNISDCFSIEILLGSGDKIIIVFENLEISCEYNAT